SILIKDLQNNPAEETYNDNQEPSNSDDDVLEEDNLANFSNRVLNMFENEYNEFDNYSIT
ncbi:11763_t:CDS:2, partial [Racocetra fulgida]